MYDKKAFLASLKHETKVITHLAAQLSPDKLDYRPSEKQRSTLDLLRFLATTGMGTTTYALTGSWDHWGSVEEKAKAIDLANFPKAMQAQLKGITKALAKLNDAALKRKTVNSFNCGKTTLGAGLVEMVLKQLVAYRMQLFLYAKASGLPQLNTDDCWRGRTSKAAKA